MKIHTDLIELVCFLIVSKILKTKVKKTIKHKIYVTMSFY